MKFPIDLTFCLSIFRAASPPPSYLWSPLFHVQRAEFLTRHISTHAMTPRQADWCPSRKEPQSRLIARHDLQVGAPLATGEQNHTTAEEMGPIPACEWQDAAWARPIQVARGPPRCFSRRHSRIPTSIGNS